MFQGLRSSMIGPAPVPNMVPQSSIGLGLPGGQVAFNLAGKKADNGPLNVNAPFGSGLKVNITRTASSDPVQNIINDIANPLGGMDVNINGGAPQAPSPQPQAPQAPAQAISGIDGSMMGLGVAPQHRPDFSAAGLARSPSNMFTHALAGSNRPLAGLESLDAMTRFLNPQTFFWHRQAGNMNGTWF